MQINFLQLKGHLWCVHLEHPSLVKLIFHRIFTNLEKVLKHAHILKVLCLPRSICVLNHALVGTHHSVLQIQEETKSNIRSAQKKHHSHSLTIAITFICESKFLKYKYILYILIYILCSIVNIVKVYIKIILNISF